MALSEPKPAWPHAPTHKLQESGTYMVTGATYQKEHHFRSAQRLDFLQGRLLQLAAELGWQLEAWAVFSNHYHFIAHSPAGVHSADSLGDLVHRFHNRTAQWVNEEDVAAGRKVWHNYWDSRLTFQNSYLTRLRYVHENSVRHGLVARATLYPWCSAGWFERSTSAAMQKSLARFKIDGVNVQDDYVPVVDGGDLRARISTV